MAHRVISSYQYKVNKSDFTQRLWLRGPLSSWAPIGPFVNPSLSLHSSMSFLSLRVALTLLRSPSRAPQSSDAGVSARIGTEQKKESLAPPRR